MNVFIRSIGTDSEINDVEISIVIKNARVKDLKNSIAAKLDVPVDQQRLYFGGKQLVDERKILGYGIQEGNVIQLMTFCNPVAVDKGSAESETHQEELVEGESLFYRIGDKIDYVESEGAWFEAKIIRILRVISNDPNDGTIEAGLEENIRFEIQMDRNEETAPIIAKFAKIRPRAYHKYTLEELEVGMRVMVNYNLTNRDQRGYWYDFEIKRISKRLSGTIFTGDSGLEEECKINFLNEIMRIEQPVLISENPNPTLRKYERRILPLYCTRCRDNASRRCKFCGCKVCSEKTSVPLMIICEECGFAYHLFCVDPPLSEIPPGDWYCPACKTNEREVIKPEDQQYMSDEDEEEEVPPEVEAMDVFGPIPGIRVGMTWKFRSQIVNVGLHRAQTSPICFSETEGAYSLLLSGENPKDTDNGDEFYFNGQSFIEDGIDKIRSSGALFLNCCQEANICDKWFFFNKDWCKGKPVRVLRSSLHSENSRFAPDEGVRYEGIYKVVEFFPYYYTADYKRKFMTFLFRRDDPSPAPWAENAERFEVIWPKGVSSEPTRYNNLEIPYEAMNWRFQSVQVYRRNCELYRQHERLKKLIKKDVHNEKLWHECTKILDEYKGYRSFSKQIQKTFKCNSCLDLSWRPVTTKCGHNFCKECIVKSFKQFKLESCPVCRSKFGRNEVFEVNQVLKRILEKLFLFRD